MKLKRLMVDADKYTLRISLNRAEQRNAFDPDMIAELTSVFKNAGRRLAERVVVLTGEGSSFCAGADLAWMKDSVNLTAAQNKKEAEQLCEMFTAVRDCHLPVIARVRGHVMGGGLGLVAASDIILAETDTQFCFSEVRFGLVPAVISPFVLAKAIPNRVVPLMMTGRVFGSAEAFDAGLVNYVGRELEINEYLKGLLTNLVKAGPEAVRETKKLLKKIAGQPPAKVKTLCCETIARRRVSPEGQEGLQAFLEKRTANWVPIDESPG